MIPRKGPVSGDLGPWIKSTGAKERRGGEARGGGRDGSIDRGGVKVGQEV